MLLLSFLHFMLNTESVTATFSRNTCRAKGNAEVGDCRKAGWKEKLQELGSGRGPWRVALIYQRGKRPLCLGAFIAADLVLTAGHCVRRNGNASGPLHIEVREVEEVRELEEVKQVEEVREVEEVGNGEDRSAVNSAERYLVIKTVVHPKYDGFNYDISIMKLEFGIRSSWKTKDASIQADFPKRPGKEVMLTAGWSTMKKGGSSREFLRATRVRLLRPADCSLFYTALPSPVLCVVPAEAPKDILCRGDSGSPLILVEEDVRVLVGILSFGPPGACQDSDYPLGFMDVKRVRKWLLETMTPELKSTGASH